MLSLPISLRLLLAARPELVTPDGEQTLLQRSYVTSSGIFKQVMFVLPEGASLMACVKRTGASTSSRGGMQSSPLPTSQHAR